MNFWKFVGKQTCLDWVAGNVREEYCNGQTCKIIVFKKSNYLLFFFLYFVLSFIFFLPFSSYQSISFCFRWFRFISLISFRFRWFRFISFLFRFALYRYPIFALCWVKICMEKVDKWLPEFTPAIFAQSSVFVDHCLFVLHFLVIVWHIS